MSDKDVDIKNMVEFESAIPAGKIPVFAWFNGVKTMVGEGYINPETLRFTTILDKNDLTDTIWDRQVEEEGFDDDGKSAFGLIHFTEATLQKRFEDVDVEETNDDRYILIYSLFEDQFRGTLITEDSLHGYVKRDYENFIYFFAELAPIS